MCFRSWVNGCAINGALRDTRYVPPMTMVTVALDAGEAARRMLHCLHMPHLSSGLMTEFAVSAQIGRAAAKQVAAIPHSSE